MTQTEKGKGLSDEKRVELLVEAIAAVNSVLQLDETLEIIVEHASKVCGADASSLLLLDESSGKLEFRVATGDKAEEIKNFTIDVGEGIVGWVVENNEPILAPDPSADPRFKKEISEEIDFKNQSILCVPMSIKGKVIGALEVINSEERSAFDEDDLFFLTAFSHQAAIALANAHLYERLTRENVTLRKELGAKINFEDIITEDGTFREILQTAKRVASSDVSVLIRGETGTGKELVAQAVHNASNRAGRPFIAVNCAAIPETLIESELFGHEKGAFTGAVSSRVGRFELANGGTLFLDEIGDLSPAMQVKLLRVLQEQAFERLGGTKTIKVDIRLIAATNRDLEKDMQEGDFREDLFYRINVVPLHLPPLKVRQGDVKVLVEFFLKRFGKAHHKQIKNIHPDAMKILIEYPWPGNVRELENTVERAVVLCTTDEITLEHISLRLPTRSARDIPSSISLREAVRRFKKDYITRTLKQMNGNQTTTAKVLKIQRTYLSKLLKELEIER